MQVVEDVGVELDASHVNRVNDFLISSLVLIRFFTWIVLKDKLLETVFEYVGLQDFPRMCHKILIDRYLIRVHADY